VKILLCGKNGQLGWELQRAMAPLGELIAHDRDTLDLARPGSIVEAVRSANPDVIVNAGAYTAVDQAESEIGPAFAVNADAPGILAGEAKRTGALLVHYSTDYVFDGRSTAPYTEDDIPAPLNAYGLSKLEGERAIRSSGCRHLILRTSWVYSARGRNFLLTILRLARERSELKIVNDQQGAPTSAAALASASASLVRKLALGEGSEGLYHMSAAGSTTWFGFASSIVSASGLPCRVLPIATQDYPVPARRPANSLLDNQKLQRNFGITLSAWDQALQHCMDEIAAAPVTASPIGRVG
jgi:dTDP-4-dehydrorhamnose reductase